MQQVILTVELSRRSFIISCDAGCTIFLARGVGAARLEKTAVTRFWGNFELLRKSFFRGKNERGLRTVDAVVV